ncbi:unnamed protein product [Vitrella brassicaformis CCMP3155]|uniref:CPW-WPC domain-containing protein n=1 Tax=Vitrella brassicaformis (strain CCMP3155) TaxID=1169540 RepID=A0A0G4F4J2_VITBC|nr:unnamed protein product [Vitrella brassicaformis CCMP3155]|eukprot:CEM06821.1 unnamed protein product [Vitrella brassicaformis CCMP3155]
MLLPVPVPAPLPPASVPNVGGGLYLFADMLAGLISQISELIGGFVPPFKVPSTKLPAFGLTPVLFGAPVVQRAADEGSKAIGLLPTPDPICVRDYSLVCPEGWRPLPGGRECQAPASYASEGDCAYILDLADLLPQQKATMANDCKFRWPCLDDACKPHGGRDYDNPCPSGWVFDGAVCEAPQSYVGGCERTFNPQGKSKDEKEQFSSACQVSWPCKEKPCTRDYSRSCPEEWEERHGMCHPPASYTGPCTHPQPVDLKTPAEKQVFAAQCGAPFPCRENMVDCEQDFDKQLCPKGWLHVGQGTCKAPDEYIPPRGCRPVINLLGFTHTQKRQLCERCGLSYPCREDCERDYRHVCPLRFTPSANGTLCEPPVDFKGPPECNKPEDFRAFTPQLKELYAETCDLAWPCVELEVTAKYPAAVMPHRPTIAKQRPYIE